MHLTNNRELAAKGQHNQHKKQNLAAPSTCISTLTSTPCTSTNTTTTATMRFQRSAAILALVHLSLVAAVPGNFINPVAKTLVDRSTTSSKDSYFMLENFYAWIPSPSAPLHPRASGSATVTPSPSSLSPSSAPKQFSSTFFTLKFMPPVAPADQESQPQWQVRCWNLTAELLCQPDVWRPCGNATYMNGTVVPEEQEEVSWRFGEGLGRIELMRQWAYTRFVLSNLGDEGKCRDGADNR